LKEYLRQFVSESIGSKIINKIGGGKNTISSKAVIAPITLEKNKKNQKDQIFVDIIENISVLFNSTGYVINSSIEGCIQMKSYLQGNPDLKLALNEDLSIGKTGSGPTIDDCNFHENVNSSEFDLTKTMRIKPPEGMNQKNYSYAKVSSLS
jgi:AP-4 complex subunit mu-1